MNREQSKLPEPILDFPLGKTTRKPAWIKRKILTWNSLLALLISVLSTLAPAWAQTQEQSFAVPSTTGVLGKKDAGALAEINAHLLALSTAEWQALEATGTLTYPGDETHAATLYLMGSKGSRLDIEMGTGTRSLRLSGAEGEFKDEKGNRGSLPPASASPGIVAFSRIWADAATSSQISLYDRSTSIYNGITLHRITIEYPIDIGIGSGPNKRTAATDLYFDPNTHLLVSSVDAMKFNGSPKQTFSRATNYEDYRQFNGIKVPTVITQYLNGQLQWTLQLSQITINVAPAANTFSF